MLAERKKLDALRREFLADEWRYLDSLNDWVNAQVHDAELPVDESGVVTMICPHDFAQVPRLRSIAFKAGLVAKPEDLKVKDAETITPPPTPPKTDKRDPDAK